MNRLRVAALAYGAIGVVAAARPALVPQTFGGTALTPEARTEVRAVYAGIPLAFTLALLRAERGGPRSAGLVSVVRNASYGMGLARLASSAAERRLAPWPTGAFAALELGLGLALTANPAQPSRTPRGTDDTR